MPPSGRTESGSPVFFDPEFSQRFRERHGENACEVSDSRQEKRAYATISRLLKKNATSRAAVSGASEPWVAFFSTSIPNSLRIVPGAALAGSVAPIRSRHFAIAPSASNAITTTGPDDMYSQSDP